MKKELVLQSVQNSVSSIFSKEDVINLIKSIEVGGRVITTNDIERAIENVICWADNNEQDLVDRSSIEFELSYDNRLEVVGAPIQLENLREALENNFMDFGEAEEEEFVRVADVVREVGGIEL
jgi:cell division ATPase FtsA